MIINSLASVVFGATDAPVTIAEKGREVVLDNGLVKAVIDQENAEITSMIYHGHEMVSTSGRHQRIYFSRDAGQGYEKVPHCSGVITGRSEDVIDYCCRHRYSPEKGDKHAWDVDVHFAICRGKAGIYIYVINSHPADYPKLEVGEWRMVWATPQNQRDRLERIYIDEARHWEIPSGEDMAAAQAVDGPKEVTLLTSGLWKGRLDCKYMYSAEYWNLPCWGFASNEKKLGAWVVLGGREFFNDGPNKQDLTAAVGTTLLHMNMNHYDGTGFTIEKGRAWRKCYGPWLLYLNDRQTADACWDDARKQADVESAQWPYAWVKSVDYPNEKGRATVSGSLVIHDSLKSAANGEGAWVGLAPVADRPGADFQYSTTGYQFWTRAGAGGIFQIPHVRPGRYTLYAYNTGTVGQFEKADIVTTAGHPLDVGKLIWEVPRQGRKIVWEIGTPDRSAAEFAHGKDYYLPLMYQRLWTEVPQPLDFTIGKSDPTKEWFYAQTCHAESNRKVPQRWRIHFNLKEPNAVPATLTLAFAGADRAKLAIYANDETRPLEYVIPTVQGGNGLVREAVHTKYSVSYVQIPAGRLRAGENVISLEQESTGDQSYVMYDYLDLEL